MSALPRPSSVQPTTSPSSSFVRRRELPALSLPRAREDRRASALMSLLLHVGIVMLLVTPFAIHHAIIEQEQGAGGSGPAGGGGGGHGGTGGVADQSERVRFVQVAAPANPVPQAVPVPVVPPPTPVPPPEPVKVEPTPTPPVETKLDIPMATKLPEVAATPGVGGGSGHDGTNGSGPGMGGGVGTGTGTGRGSGVGPGTGGGTQENYPPTTQELLIPPMPIPQDARGMRIIAEFDVDSTGRVLSFDFTPTRDGGYNRKLGEAFRGFRFKPGTTPTGRPLRMKTQVIVYLP